MAYLTESSKWNAYQFNDPFASDKFIIGNKSSKICCRPNCDLSLQTSLKTEVVFFDTPDEAMASGYSKCRHCLISDEDADSLNTISIDVDLLIKTVAAVNSQIGFVPPLDEDDPDTQFIREAVIRKNKLRRGSVPAIHLNSVSLSKNTSSNISKNETDHVKLVDLACRHIALAAASTALQMHDDENSTSRQQLRLLEYQQQVLQDKASGNKKKRRRGGVLGFKELAGKSKLSPWHFHRVFKSVTGLTPKVYGDKCWEFVKKYIERHGSYVSQNAITMSTSLTNPSASDDQSNSNDEPATLRSKSTTTTTRAKLEETEMLSPIEIDQKRESPFSSTIDDLTTTPLSMASFGKVYTSPEFNTNPKLESNMAQLATGDLFMDPLMPTLENLPTESVFSSTDLSNQLLDFSYNAEQPLFHQDYQLSGGLQLPTQSKDISSIHLRTQSAPLDSKMSIEIPEFNLSLAANNDWNLLKSQNSMTNPFQLQQQQQPLQQTMNSPFHLDLLALDRANSDSGEYSQTPFEFDLNNYGYFGDFTSVDPLETTI